jgi:hypothetical protein
MKKKTILFDKSGSRDWPGFLGGVKICKADSVSTFVSYKPKDVLLYVIHWTDFKDSNEVNSKGQFRQFNYKNVLWYSGEAATIPRSLPGHTYNTNVPHGIKKNDNFFNLIAKLINGINVHGIKEDVWNALYPHENTHLVAISILCQGYLIVHAESKERDKYWNVIKPSLQQIGWVDLMMNKDGTNHSLIRDDISSQLPYVRKARWWLDAIKTNSNFMKGLTEELDKIGKEKLNNMAMSLFDKLNNAEDVESPEEVAHVYCAIDNELAK